MGKIASRLKPVLLTSNIQITNNALYQVISTLIGLIDSLEASGSGGGSSSGGGSTTIVLRNFIGIPGADGEEGENGSPGPPGIRGRIGVTGAQGPIGPVVINNDGEDGLDGQNIPVRGPQGIQGIQGPRGQPAIIVISGEDGEDSFVPGPKGADGSTGTVIAYVVAGSDESVTSNTTPQDDNELFASVEANSVYIFELVLWFTSGTSTGVDINWNFTFPTSATISILIYDLIDTATTIQNLALSARYQESSPSTTGNAGVLSTATLQASPMLLKGVLRTGANAGTLQFRFAQKTSSGTALVRKADSYLKLEKVA